MDTVKAPGKSLAFPELPVLMYVECPSVHPVPHHDEAHVGPYGVEAPPDWSFVMTVTEVVMEVRRGTIENDEKPDGTKGLNGDKV